MPAPSTSPRPATVPSLLRAKLAGGDTGAAFVHRRGREWLAESWRDVDEQVLAIATALAALDLPTGGAVAVVGRESVEGHVVALAAQYLGFAALVHLDVGGSAETLAAALAAADVSVVVSTDAEAATAVSECGHRLHRGVLTIDPDPESDWSSFVAAGRTVDPDLVEARRLAVRPDHPAVVLIATDGMPWTLSHGAAVAVAAAVIEATSIGDDDTVYVTDGVAPGVDVSITLAQLATGFARVVPHAPGSGSEFRDAGPTVLFADAGEVRALHQRMLGSGPVTLQGRQLERALEAAAQVRSLTASGGTITTALRRRALPLTEAAAFLGARLTAVHVVGEVPDATVEFYAGVGATATTLGEVGVLLETVLAPAGSAARSGDPAPSPTIERRQSGPPDRRTETPVAARPRPAPPRPGESLLDALLRSRRDLAAAAAAKTGGLPVRAPSSGRNAEIASTFSGVSDGSRDATPTTRRTTRGARHDQS